MSMMNANVAATTAMTANKPLDFELPEIGEAEFSNEELAEDMDGFTIKCISQSRLALKQNKKARMTAGNA